MSRPRSLVALALHVVRLRWAALGRAGQIAAIAALVLGSVALLGAGRCLLGGCPMSSSPCPGSKAALMAADDASPCPFAGEKSHAVAKPCPHAR